MSITLTAPPAPPAPPPRPYPVQVHADPEPDASRWLWLVKWLLLIPHAIVLAFLWIAFVVLSLFAFVAILVTGRYPRAVFDFNVGVLRWSWRVSYYGYSALGTDRYPPFTLADVPDYPAHLEVDYPEHLSRGLVLVKWWLLALPHYVVVGLLVGGGTCWATKDDSRAHLAWGGGLVGLLVLVAAVVLTTTGRYPRPVYDLVMGLNRWVLRVCAYAALMTDTYPPFRLDLGPDEPGRVPPVDPQGQPLAPAVATEPQGHGVATVPPSPAQTGMVRTGWTAGRITGVVIGSIVGMSALAVLTGSMALLVADSAMRDSTGYVTTAQRHVTSAGYAVAMTSVVIDTAPEAATLPQRILGDVRLRVTSSSGDPVFVGIASTTALQQNLGDVARTVPDATWRGGGDIAGQAPTVPPTQLGIWEASAVGTGTQELKWAPRSGDWGFVLMNADGSAAVSAQVSVGAQLPWLGGVGIAGLFGGVLLLVGGVSLVAITTRRASSG